MNRTLQELRREELIVLRERELVILNLAAMENVAMFDPAYLHLQTGGIGPGEGLRWPA